MVADDTKVDHKDQFNSTYVPMDYSEVEKFKDGKLIYDLPLGSSQVKIVSLEGSEKVGITPE
jgi:hypothetical protein